MKQLTLTIEDISSICMALGHLLHAGIASGDAFNLLCDGEDKGAKRDMLQAMAVKADNGMIISQIFRESGAFPSYVCTLLEVGEQVGKTEETLYALSSYYSNRARMAQQLSSAFLYPATLMTVLLAVVFVLLVWVLPIFDEVYAQLGSHLTGLAGALLSFGKFLRRALPVLLVIVAAIVLLIFALHFSHSFRRWIVKQLKSFRGDRGIIRQISTARFIQALSMAISSGLSAEQAVTLAIPLADDSAAFRRRCDACLSSLEKGTSLPHALRDAGLINAADARLLDAGLRSGQADKVMVEIARHSLDDSQSALEQLAAKLEPTMMIIACVLVGAVLLSVMLPLMRIMTAIG
jgi:type IV pilus assembly protein PilC